MDDKFFSTEGGNRVIKLGLRAAVVIAIVVALGVGSMIYFMVQGGEWLYSSYGNWRNSNSEFSAWNPINNIRNIFQRPTSTSQAVEPIRVVSEESQVIEVVKRASPAVVSIIESAEVPRLEQCLQQNELFPGLPQEFQGLFSVPGLCQNGTERKRVGAGTGFIVSADGYIMTNRHVVDQQNAEYTVVLNDEKNYGTKVAARVVARDPNNDIAVLKIDKTGLPFLTFSDSSKLNVGQTAIAIGYSLGEFDNTVSKGVVSGLSRSITASGGSRGVQQLRGLIQTDAAINPGNSGGPLLDISGRVIGMNVAMAQAQSIGFAIPSNKVKNAFDQVKSSGAIVAPERAFLGVRYVPINEDLKSKNNLPYDYGMLVSRGESPSDLAIVPGSPADKAGIVENDIILELNGRQLNERYGLADAVANLKPGDEVRLKVLHRGEERNMTVRLEKMR